MKNINSIRSNPITSTKEIKDILLREIMLKSMVNNDKTNATAVIVIASALIKDDNNFKKKNRRNRPINIK